MENLAIARIFSEIADLLEIKGENPFKIRAYRNAADTITHATERLASCTEQQLRAIPGIGKDLAAKIVEIAATGESKFHGELLAAFPGSILDLLRLPGVGPKTVAQLYADAGIANLDQLEAACRDGRLRSLKGMGQKKEQLILKALDERRQRAGRHLMPKAAEAAQLLVDHLQAQSPQTAFTIVGSLRRGVDTTGDIDILAAGGDNDVMNTLARHPLVERTLAQGATKTSVLLKGGMQADLRLVPRDSLGAALQYFTGSKAHNIALRDRAIGRALKLNEYGLFRMTDNVNIASRTEHEIYEALGLSFVPPELREDRGELAAAEGKTLPNLIALSDVRGDLHSHTNATDGRADIETMALAARDAGLSYLAITDHSKALAMSNGLDEDRALAHARRIRDVGARLEGITLLAGIECDIRPDGTMDLSEDCLAQLDIVVASVHSAFSQDEVEMTERVLRAVECPYVDVIGHPTGRRLLKREPSKLNVNRLIDAAVQSRVALEINCHPERLDLCDTQVRTAKERGAKIIISTDSHEPRSFQLMKWGVLVARRGWLTAVDVLNTLPVADFRAALRRGRPKP
jgi:DNA polymerase (family 10)